MSNKVRLIMKSITKTVLVICLSIALVFSNPSNANAAGGGRMGGGSFRMPSRSYSAPSRSYAPSGGYYSPYGGGGLGFNFLLPFLGFGGGFGGLFSIFIFLAFANYAVQIFRKFTDNENPEIEYNNSQISVAKVQIGLLSKGRYLQEELNKLALVADTNSDEGRTQVLQEASLAILRHPEYWAYGHTESQKVGLQLAEAKFNQLAITERSKLTEETLVNVNNQLRQSSGHNAILLSEENNSEYFIATIIVGVEGKLELPKINSSEDLSQALRKIASVGSDRLLAMEVLWTPQLETDILTSDDLIAYYPDLVIL